ncbi:MAG: metallophosphoesterase, partial [Methylocystaceae bacterium]
THLGQMWPLNYITRRVFLADYGLYQQASLQAVISNGVGTWGPPIRVGNRPEIVDIVLSFGD